MRALDDCYKYQLDFSKPTKANSILASGRTIMILKKDDTGKAVKVFVAYDRDTKIQLSQHWIKEELVKYIQSRDLSALGYTEKSLF